VTPAGRGDDLDITRLGTGAASPADAPQAPRAPGSRLVPATPIVPRAPLTPIAPRSPISGNAPTMAASSFSSGSGGRRLSGPEAIDHGRFAPGMIVAGRYRMIGRLGSGGMGEVYRADDLKLGQPVALKFLPEAVDKDPARLTQLHSEVRIARQISHPHVCRVYDIDEYEGHTFLSMEYVDGEDLASLLRRVGRLAQHRAIELARQICAGLAAAHDRGVVHRDLKPANIMLDGEGQIRITDFGLAGAIGDSPRAGTPAYMAPEQLAGQPVTPRSDLYALGLVLYELFTGQRALNARNLAELIARREEVEITPPTAIVHDLDPAIERVIMRCLERDPARRPATALAVAAALPGGDPLAAALAAGTTLSPEAVAAAGEESAWALRPALASLAFVLAGLVALVLMGDRVLITGYVPLDAPAAVMVDRAEQIRQKLGYREPFADRASGLSVDLEAARFLVNHVAPAERAAALARTRPSTLQLWYRTSPRALMPSAPVPGAVMDDPPLTVSGMTTTVVDGKGRLVSFDAVPPQREPGPDATTASTPSQTQTQPPPQRQGPTPPSTQTQTESPQPAMMPEWNVLFEAADLPRDRFRSVAPRWTPPAYADTRAAWEGTLADSPDTTLRLEAAGYRGRVTSFAIIGPATTPDRMAVLVPTFSQRWVSMLGGFFILAIMCGAAAVSRHNLRNGRGDKRGALRIAVIMLVVDLARRVLLGAHLALVDFSIGFVLGNLAFSIFLAAGTWGLYMALEPFVRRYWPDSLVSWTRLLGGKLRDPRIGKDVLLGTVAGILMTLASWGHNLLPMLAGQPPLAPGWPALRYLEGVNEAIATADRLAVVGIFNGMAVIFVVVLLRVLVRRVWLAAILAIALFSINAIAAVISLQSPWLEAVGPLVVTSLMVFSAIRQGMLATLVAFLVIFLLEAAPLTADPAKWYFSTGVAITLIVAALALAAFSWARAGEPLFGRPLLD
jgi:hypothetical protein